MTTRSVRTRGDLRRIRLPTPRPAETFAIAREDPRIERVVVPPAIIESSRPNEHETSFRARARSLVLSIPAGNQASDWQVYESTRPSMILVNASASSGSFTRFAVEALPGEHDNATDAAPALVASGRCIILPWGGRWWLRLRNLGDTAALTAATVVLAAYEPPPGVSAADLLAARLPGLSYESAFVTTADVGPHTLLNADPDRQTLILSVSAGAVNYLVTFSDAAPGATNSFLVRPTDPPLVFGPDTCTKTAVRVLASGVGAGTITATVGYL